MTNTPPRPGFDSITDARYPAGASCQVLVDRPGKRPTWLRGTVVATWRQQMYGHTVVEAHVNSMGRTFRNCDPDCVRVA